MRTLVIVAGLLIWGCAPQGPDHTQPQDDWQISVLPSSVRLDPASIEIIDSRFPLAKTSGDLLRKNWIFDGEEVSLKAARGEYVSFQLVLLNHTDEEMKDIGLDLPPFAQDQGQLNIKPELFLEWAVEVKTPSTGYPKASLGRGWYPDALIPLDQIQADTALVRGRWTYPLELPDFNNRIDSQKAMIIWVDQYVPKDASGDYKTHFSVTIGTETKTIAVNLSVWNFTLPNENKLRASLQHEGFLSGKDEGFELEIYQLFKRNRMSLMDPTYKPYLTRTESGGVQFDWQSFDERLTKYFTGSAFTQEYGYNYGPGYAEPIEAFIVPFNVRGKHGNRGWPDVGSPAQERQPTNQALYSETIRQVRSHLQELIDPEKTEITVYLNGLDESYFPEAWDRMVYYGDIFKEVYPEAHFRIDGAYGEEAMAVVKNSIDSWASHTLNYNIDKVRKYQEMGIEDWLYGPLLYESKVNSWVGSSTFIDLPLVNDRALSWSCWKYNTYSWISWGIGAGWRHAWYDPETWKDRYKQGADSDPGYYFKKLNGSALLAYAPGIIPGVDVVCPSIRLKSIRDGVQEYEYMRLLAQLDGNDDRVDRIVNSIIKKPFGDESIGNLDVWSFDVEVWDRKRIELGEMIEEAQLNTNKD